LFSIINIDEIKICIINRIFGEKFFSWSDKAPERKIIKKSILDDKLKSFPKKKKKKNKI